MSEERFIFDGVFVRLGFIFSGNANCVKELHHAMIW